MVGCSHHVPCRLIIQTFHLCLKKWKVKYPTDAFLKNYFLVFLSGCLILFLLCNCQLLVNCFSPVIYFEDNYEVCFILCTGCDSGWDNLLFFSFWIPSGLRQDFCVFLLCLVRSGYVYTFHLGKRDAEMLYCSGLSSQILLCIAVTLLQYI